MSTKPQTPDTAAAATDAAGAAPPVDVNDYDAAWAEGAADLVPPKTPAVAVKDAGESNAASGAADPAVEGADPTPAGGEAGTVATVDSSAAAVSAADTAAAATAAAAAEESPETKIARLEAENAALRAPKPATPAPAPAAEAAPAPAAEAKPAEIEWYKPTTEESKALTQYAENWPDHAVANDVRTKQAVYNAVQYVFAKMHEVYAPVLQRFQQTSDAISEQLTLGALRSEHEDYDEVYNDVVAWVPTLPAAFRQGAERVMKEGTPEEVAELITAFKAQKPAGATPTAPAAAPRKAELSAPAKKAAQALTVIHSKRTTPTAPADANDFDGAWNEAVNQK